MGKDTESLELGIAERYPYLAQKTGGTLVIPKAGGACDENMRELYGRLHPWRNAILAFRGTNAAGNLLIAAQQVTIFDKGQEQNGSAPMTNELTAADTDLIQDGGMVDSGDKFVCIGMSVEPMEPWAVAAGDPLNAATRQFSQVLSEDYGPRALRALAFMAAAELQHRSKNACRYHLGTMGDWGSWSRNAQNAGGSPGGLPGVFTLFSVEAISGGSTDSDSFKLLWKLFANAQIGPGLQALPANVDFALPYRVSLWGYPVCVGAQSRTSDYQVDKIQT